MSIDTIRTPNTQIRGYGVVFVRAFDDEQFRPHAVLEIGESVVVGSFLGRSCRSDIPEYSGFIERFLKCLGSEGDSARIVVFPSRYSRIIHGKRADIMRSSAYCTETFTRAFGYLACWSEAIRSRIRLCVCGRNE